MRGLSSRALHERIPNLVYVRAAVEELPAELTGVADRVSVVLPWGSLLAAVTRPEPNVLHGLRALCQPGARLAVLLGIDAARDRAELVRLGLASLGDVPLAATLAEPYARAGFRLEGVRSVSRDSLAAWPSTWARRLSQASGRVLQLVTAVAVTSVDMPKNRHGRRSV